MDVRHEYPRPQHVREAWMSLNGTWDFKMDDQHGGLAESWYEDGSFDRKINVPFCYQSKLSGIGETEFHDVVWYRRTFRIPSEQAGKRTILHFGAVDYDAQVWVDGQHVCIH